MMVPGWRKELEVELKNEDSDNFNFEKGRQDKKENYRPVSGLSVVGNLL